MQKLSENQGMARGSEMKTPREVVDEQAEDDGLWFEARTAPEAYLQQELRKLHAAVEAAEKEKDG